MDEPWLVSPHATGSLRCVDVLELEGKWGVDYELAHADGSHELRVNTVQVD